MKRILLLLLLPSLMFAQSLHSDFVLNQKEFIKQSKFPKENNLTLKKKKTGLAILYSLLLPGMGELYAGDYSTGKYFTIAEGAFVSALVGFNVYGKWQENNYKEFAASFGSANINGKDDKYFADLANYLNIDQYNKIKELDRKFDETYDPNTHYWKWKDQTQRKEYRTMWLASERAYNNIQFAVGAMILNRVASAINAVRLVVRHNKNLESKDLSWNIYFGTKAITPASTSLTVNFVSTF